jgi:peptidyl-tRNA hydrolase, PTH2 family
MADRAPPSSTAVIISTVILSLIAGYMLGIGSSLGLFPSPFLQSPEQRAASHKTKTSNYDDEEESSEEEVDGVLLDHAPNWANGEAADMRDGLKASKKEAPEKLEWENSSDECKMVLIVRTDLGMTKGPSVSYPSLLPPPPSLLPLHLPSSLLPIVL